MAETIIVVVEQREGKLNRVSWETLAAGQALAKETGWSLEAAVLGSNISALGNELAAKNLARVYVLDSPRLAPYTPDVFTAALRDFLAAHQPHVVLMPHTYQV